MKNNVVNVQRCKEEKVEEDTYFQVPTHRWMSKPHHVYKEPDHMLDEWFDFWSRQDTRRYPQIDNIMYIPEKQFMKLHS